MNPPLKRVNNEYIKVPPLYTGYDLRVINSNIGRSLYMAHPKEKQWIDTLAAYFKFEILNERPLESRKSFDVLIRYKGEEMYFVDLVDTDLTKIRAIQSYTEHRYNEENKRRILVTTFLKSQWDLIKNKEKYLERLIISKQDFDELFAQKKQAGITL
jgi:hypothetical protein